MPPVCGQISRSWTLSAEIPEDSEFSARNIDQSDTALARDGIFFALEMQDQIADLKLAFLDNRTRSSFITCDDPVVQTNRLYVQKVGDTNFGLGSGGAIFYLPLSPRIAMLLYDGDVYSIPKTGRHWVLIEREGDVHAFNDLIFLKARENIYFMDGSDFSRARFERMADRRIVDWHRGRVLVPVGEDEKGRIFANVDEPPPEGGYVIATSQQHPLPRDWPSVVQYRHPCNRLRKWLRHGLCSKAHDPAEARGVVKIKV